MQALLGSLGNTIGNAITHALHANQEQMNKAMKAAINGRHQQYRPDHVLPDQYLQLDASKIVVHTGKDACILLSQTAYLLPNFTAVRCS